MSRPGSAEWAAWAAWDVVAAREREARARATLASAAEAMAAGRAQARRWAEMLAAHDDEEVADLREEVADLLARGEEEEAALALAERAAALRVAMAAFVRRPRAEAWARVERAAVALATVRAEASS